MKYKVGDKVIALIERGVAKEGDVGVVDAVHKDTYTVGFYATEDALIDSVSYYQDELRPAEEKTMDSPFDKGERVMTKAEVAGYPAGLIGIVMDVYPEKHALAVQVIKDGDDFPAILSYSEENVAKIG